MTFRETTNSMLRSRKIICHHSNTGKSMEKFEWWHGVDGGLFEGVDGTGVFFGVGESAVSEDAGYGLDIGSVAQQVRSATMTGAVPGNVLFDTGTGDSMAKSFQTHGVAGKWEDNLIAVAVFRLAYEGQKFVIERDGNSAGCAMGFGLALLKLQQLV